MLADRRSEDEGCDPGVGDGARGVRDGYAHARGAGVRRRAAELRRRRGRPVVRDGWRRRRHAVLRRGRAALHAGRADVRPDGPRPLMRRALWALPLLLAAASCLPRKPQAYQRPAEPARRDYHRLTGAEVVGSPREVPAEPHAVPASDEIDREVDRILSTPGEMTDTQAPQGRPTRSLDGALRTLDRPHQGMSERAECPGGVTLSGLCCVRGCACGASCISCSRRCHR